MKLKKNIKFLLILSTILLFGKSVIADEVKINKYDIYNILKGDRKMT